ncbi:MAG: hypothetical protein ABR555_19360 [Pyrinomonadaceae bacterium]
MRGFARIVHVQRKIGRLDEAQQAAKRAVKYDKGSVDQLFLVALEKGDLAAATKIAEAFKEVQSIDRGARGNQATSAVLISLTQAIRMPHPSLRGRWGLVPCNKAKDILALITA